jgi:plastocyanin
MPNGVYRVNPDGSVTNIADFLTWTAENPVEHIPYDLGPESETFAMLAGDGFLWVLESNSGQVVKVTPQGEITRVADLSDGHLVPTGFALSPNGGVYVGFLTSAPYPDGGSKVIEVLPDGSFSDVWTGLTAVTGLAVGKDGTLYAAEMSTGNTDAPPFTMANSGRIVRQTGPSSLAEVVTGIDYPIAMRMGPDNALYIAFPAFGGDPPIGGILRVDLSYPQPMTVSPDILNLDLCDVALPSSTPPAGDMDDMGGDSMASPEAGDDPMPATPADPPVPPSDPGKEETGANAVTIDNFAFNPGTIEIPAGTVVTWTNLDTTAHTATAQDGSFNSGNLNPGQSFSFKFDTPGTYVYNCQYHPNMQATIVVK